jgi:hypothetical protein
MEGRNGEQGDEERFAGHGCGMKCMQVLAAKVVD